jgi:hypothetical protein
MPAIPARRNEESNMSEFYVGKQTINGIEWRSAVPVSEWTKIGTKAVCETAEQAREAAAAGEFWTASTVHVGSRDESGEIQIVDTLRRGYHDDPSKWESGAEAQVIG